ncbi:hypothetical protein IT570_06015 [Candidatus Sumerlaeota bacterium]|nr:hypothetical protein [Candidatus Sumerlaeota bacterium]
MPVLSRLTAVLIILLTAGCAATKASINTQKATSDDGSWFYLDAKDITSGPHHLNHGKIFGKYVDGYNRTILEAIDTVQAHQPDGGGYFIGVKAKPPETPVGYELSLFGRPLLKPTRTTSYCSGSSYTAFIEALNVIYPDGATRLDPVRTEAMRMQEPDGGRREDSVKFWGHWNDDGFGNDFALVQYSGMGTVITPQQARPGDFMNISWTNGNGHSVIFLGWTKNEGGAKGLSFWSSQTSTNGYGDVHLPNLDKVKVVKVVRMTNPDKLFTFDVTTPVNRKVPGDKVEPATVAAGGN